MFTVVISFISSHWLALHVILRGEDVRLEGTYKSSILLEECVKQLLKENSDKLPQFELKKIEDLKSYRIVRDDITLFHNLKLCDIVGYFQAEPNFHNISAPQANTNNTNNNNNNNNNAAVSMSIPHAANHGAPLDLHLLRNENGDQQKFLGISSIALFSLILLLLFQLLVPLLRCCLSVLRL
jgi:hypothetical protein